MWRPSSARPTASTPRRSAPPGGGMERSSSTRPSIGMWPPTRTGPIMSGSALRSTPRRRTSFGVTWSMTACRSMTGLGLEGGNGYKVEDSCGNCGCHNWDCLSELLVPETQENHRSTGDPKSITAQGHLWRAHSIAQARREATEGQKAAEHVGWAIEGVSPGHGHGRSSRARGRGARGAQQPVGSRESPWWRAGLWSQSKEEEEIYLLPFGKQVAQERGHVQGPSFFLISVTVMDWNGGRGVKNVLSSPEERGRDKRRRLAPP